MPCDARPLTPAEREHVEDVFRRLCAHFKEWPEYHDDPLALIGFAAYEHVADSECCRSIIAEAEPFAWGREMIETYGFEWVMIQDDDGPRYGLNHPKLDDPRDLEAWLDVPEIEIQRRLAL